MLTNPTVNHALRRSIHAERFVKTHACSNENMAWHYFQFAVKYSTAVKTALGALLGLHCLRSL